MTKAKKAAIVEEAVIVEKTPAKCRRKPTTKKAPKPAAKKDTGPRVRVFAVNGPISGKELVEALGGEPAELLESNNLEPFFSKFGACAIQIESTFHFLSADGFDTFNADEVLKVQIEETLKHAVLTGDVLDEMDSLEKVAQTKLFKIRAASTVLKPMMRLDWVDLDATLVCLFAHDFIDTKGERDTKLVSFYADSGLLVRIAPATARGMLPIKLVTDMHSGETTQFGGFAFASDEEPSAE